jgi:hypothetical protein
MDSTKKIALGFMAVGVLGTLAFVVTRPAPRPGTAASPTDAAAPAAHDTVLAGTAPAKPARAGRFVGEWEQTAGSVKVTCNGKLAREVPVAGKHFKITQDGANLRLADNACEFQLKAEGPIASAVSDTCVPKNASSPPVKIKKQTVETADGEVAKIAFEGSFESPLAKEGKSMTCSIVAETAARRL